MSAALHPSSDGPTATKRQGAHLNRAGESIRRRGEQEHRADYGDLAIAGFPPMMLPVDESERLSGMVRISSVWIGWSGPSNIPWMVGEPWQKTAKTG